MTTATLRAQSVQEIPLDQLDVHRLNPRKDAGDVAELAASMRTSGVLEPLIAVKDNGGYAVVAGSRRLAAAKVAGLKTVPVLVREMTDADVAAAALIENIQREDLSPLDEARAYREWLQLTGKAQKDLAERVGKHPSTIANALRLLEAPAPVQKALEDGAITAAHARIALSVPTELVPALDLKKGVRTEELEYQAQRLKQSAAVIAKMRKAIDAAKADGADVTWADGERWIGGAKVDLASLFGTPSKKVAGHILGSHHLSAAPWYAPGKLELHDEACSCRAVAPREDGGLERVCVSPAGFKKYLAAIAKAAQVRGASKKKVAGRAAKEAAKQRDLKLATSEASKALDGKQMKYARLNLVPDPRLLRGGIEGEAARLALFGFVSKFSDGLRAKTWRVALWKQITELPVKEVRARVAKWAIAMAVREIQDDHKTRREVQALVNEHYKAGRTR